jgi:hypothetical protein
MKNLLFLVVVFGALFIYATNSNVKEKIDSGIKKIENEVGGGNTSHSSNPINEDFNFEKASQGYSQETKNYFKEVCYGSEFEGSGSVKRWNSDIKIYVSGNQDYLKEELSDIVSDLNSLINTIDIEIVSNQNEANMFVYFCHGNDFANIEPNVADKVSSNWGLFCTYHNGNTINKATLYVDVVRCNSIDAQKHLLREELTQSLGIQKDSYSYSNSIFYQGWTEVTEYATIDEEVIKILYN